MDKEGLSLFIALRWMQRPERVMVGLTENIQACLRDFQMGTASMARKRHLASTARGLLCFCLMTLVTTGLIRSIRIIRGRNKPISDAKHCIRSSKRLPKRRLHTAFPASTCIRPCSAQPLFNANVCILSRKRLHAFLQTFATAIVNVCIRHRKRLR